MLSGSKLHVLLSVFKIPHEAQGLYEADDELYLTKQSCIVVLFIGSGVTANEPRLPHSWKYLLKGF